MQADFDPAKSHEVHTDAGRIVVAVDARYTVATASFYPSGVGAFDPEDVKAALAEIGVVAEIDEERIKRVASEASERGQPLEGVVVAQAKRPVHGEDAYLEFPPLQRLVRVDSDPEDPIELSQKRIINVEAGETVAIYHPLTDGVPGVNLKGNYIPAEPGIDATQRPDRNLHRNDREIVSDIDGRLIIEERRIYVDENVVIDGDLTVLNGDIDFVGNILVTGNVESGLSIVCKKNITVRGSLIGSDVECHGDLIVGQGIIGSEETVVEVFGNLETAFIENAEVRVWGSCKVRDCVSSSLLLCRGRVEVYGGDGQIVSGEIYARDGIRAWEVGIEVGTKVKLHVGNDELARRKIEELEKEIAIAQKRIERIKELDQKLGPMSRAYQLLTPAKREEIEMLLEQLPRIEEFVAEASAQRQDLEASLKPNFEATVDVVGVVNEDAIIEYPVGRLIVRPALRGVQFYFKQDEATIGQRGRAA